MQQHHDIFFYIFSQQLQRKQKSQSNAGRDAVIHAK